MVKYLCLILSLLSWSQPMWAQTPFTFFHLNIGETLPESPVYHISQGYNDEIWIATGKGVLNLNGTRSKMYAIPSGYSANDVRTILHNEDGSAWVATAGPLLKMTADREFVPHGIPYIREGRIFDMVQDASGIIWFLGAEQVFCLVSPGNSKVWSKGESGLQGSWKFDRDFDGEGILIISESAQVNMTIDGPTQIPRSDGELISGSDVYHHGSQASSRKYAFDENTLSLELSVDNEVDSSLSMSVLEGQFTTVFVDKEGNMWVGTQHEGVYMLSRSQVEMVYEHLLLAHREDTDRDDAFSALGGQGLWLSDRNRILKRRGFAEEWTFLDNESILSVASIQDGWIASSATTLYYDNGAGDVKNISLAGITSLGLTADEQVLLSLGNRFHYQVDPALLPELLNSPEPTSWLRTQSSWTQEGFSQKGIMTIDGTWYVLVEGGIIIKTSGQAGEVSGEISGTGDYSELSSLDSITVVAAKRSGGLSVFQHGKQLHASAVDSSWPYGAISGLHVDEEGIWVLTELGVVRYAGIQSVLTSSEGYLFPGTAQLVKESTAVVLGKHGLDLLVQNEIWTVLVPNLASFSTIELSLDCIYISGSSCIKPWNGLRKVPEDSTDFVFEVSTGSYSFLESQQLEYSLNGKTWIPVEKGVIELNSLPVAEYHLWLRLRSGDLVLAETSEALGFIITPPFYESWWFVFLAAIMMVGLVWAGLNLYYGETERKKLEILVEQRTQDLDASIIELQQKNEDLEQFAYIASHDLKSPLRGMIGHLQLLERKYIKVLGKQGKESIQHAVGEAKRLYEMVNDLLDFASVGSEKLEKRWVTLDNMLKNLILGMKIQLNEINGQVLADPMPVVMVVPSQWEALLRNLIENGLKFNNTSTPEVRISYEEKDGMHLFCIADNGIGLEEKYHAKAFELYGRLNPEYPGTGIGLAICKRVVERHGGTIWMESTLGKGTSFFFTLPQHTTEEESTAR